jgi:hypothetical protein
MGKLRASPVLSALLCSLLLLASFSVLLTAVPETSASDIDVPSTPHDQPVLDTTGFLETAYSDVAIYPAAPMPNSLYASTPSCVLFNVTASVPVSPDDVIVSIDDVPLGHPVIPEFPRFQLNLTDPLSTGEHTINVSVASGAASAEWTFDIVEDADVAPYLTLLSPADGAWLNYAPDSITVSLTDSDPPSQHPEVTITFDGNPLQTYPQNGTNLYSAIVPSGPVSDHSVAIVGEIHVDGRVVSKEWHILIDPLVLREPDMHDLYPVPDSVVTSLPTYVQAELFRGDPPVSVEAESAEVYVDGTLYYPDPLVDDTIHVTISPLPVGSHHVKVGVDTSNGWLIREWDFTYDPAAQFSFVKVYYGDEYSMLAPDTWTAEMDEVISGSRFDLVFTGHQIDGFYQNVNVQSGTGPKTDYDRSFFSNYLANTMAALADQGITVSEVGELNYTTVGDLTAGIWKLYWSGNGIMDAQALLVDPDSGRYWLITCTASQGSFGSVWPTFESMITSLEVEDGGLYFGYTHYTRASDYDLYIPDGWTTQAEYETGGITFSLFVTGPREDDFTVNILLTNGTDYSMKEDQTYLRAQINDRFLKELEDQGVHATIYEQPTFRTVSNYTAMVFSIKWTTMPVIQKIVIIVDEEHHRYWMFTCSAAESTYDKYSETFDTVVNSFNATSEGSGDFNPLSGDFPVLLIGGVAAGVVLVVIMAVAVLGARRKV